LAVVEEGRSLILAWLDSAMKQVGHPYFEQIRALFDNRVAHQVIKQGHFNLSSKNG
jgi:hypothetical protein